MGSCSPSWALLHFSPSKFENDRLGSAAKYVGSSQEDRNISDFILVLSGINCLGHKMASTSLSLSRVLLFFLNFSFVQGNVVDLRQT